MPGSLGTKSAFADELNALENEGAEGAAVEGLIGSAELSEVVAQQVGVDIQKELPPSEMAEPVLAAVAPQVSKVISELDGNIDVPPSGQGAEDAGTQPETVLSGTGSKNGGSSVGEGSLPGVAVAPATGDGVKSAGSKSGQAQVPPVGPHSAEVKSGAHGQAQPEGSVKPTLAEKAPAQMNVVGEADKGEAAPVKSGVVPVPAQANANEVSTDADLTGKAVRGVEAPAAAVAKATGESVENTSAVVDARPKAATARRWQSELPQELRAPVARAGQAPEQNDAEISLASASPVSGKTAGAVQSAVNVPTNVDTGAADVVQVPATGTAKEAGTLPETAIAVEGGKTRSGPQVAEVAQENAARVQGDAATVVANAGARSPAASGSNVPVSEAVAGQAPVAPPPNSNGSEVSSTSEPVADEIVLASGKQVSEAGGDAADTVKRDHSAGADASAERPGQPANKVVGTAAPVVNAVLASQMMADESEITTSLTEVSVTGEGAATVRGGDLSGAVRTEGLQTPSQAQSGQVATQVAAEIARNLKNGQTRFQMRFDPPELGRVEVNMKVASDGSVQAHLIVERPETLDMFLRDQRGLERALEAAGLNTNSSDLQFSLKQEGGGEFASGDGAPEHSSGDARGEGGSNGAEGDPADEEIIRMTLAEQRGGLDFKV